MVDASIQVCPLVRSEFLTRLKVLAWQYNPLRK